MKKLVGVIRVVFALFVLVVVALMAFAIKDISLYISVNGVIIACVLEILAIWASFIGAKKGLIVNVVSIAFSVVAAIIAFKIFSEMKGWTDLKLFGSLALGFAIVPVLDILVSSKKSSKSK